MRINVKGLNWANVTLADGTSETYWYAWKGGPRLQGEYGSPEFIASYNAAIATKTVAPDGRLLSSPARLPTCHKIFSDCEIGRAPTTSSRSRRSNRNSAIVPSRRFRTLARAVFSWAGGTSLPYSQSGRPTMPGRYSPGAVVGERARQDHREPLRTRRPRLSRHASRLCMDHRGRSSVSQGRAIAFASAALARVVDRTAARRSVALDVERLQRLGDQATAVEKCWSPTPGCERHDFSRRTA